MVAENAAEDAVLRGFYGRGVEVWESHVQRGGRDADTQGVIQMRHLPMILALTGLFATTTTSVWPQDRLPEPVQVVPARPPQSTMLVMPMPEAMLDKVSRGTLTAKFPPEVLDSVLRGAYHMPSHPSLPPLPEPPYRVRPEGEIQHRLLAAPTSAPGWRLVAPELLPRPSATPSTAPRP